MEQKSIFDDLNEQRRERLRSLGWRPAGGVTRGRLVWRDPETGAVLDEPEAFKRLEGMDREAAGKGGRP